MEGKKYSLITVLMFFVVLADISADNRSEIYSAYINDRMDQWKAVIDKMQSSGTKDNEQLLELLNYQYGYIGYCLGFKKEAEARKYLELAENNLEQLEKAKFRIPVLYAYRSAFYGYRISLNTISAPFNGPKSINSAKKAVELDKENYLGYTQLGNAYFYMPAALGGSKKTAFEYFSKAQSIMEKDPSLTEKNWNYLSLLVTIAQSHTYLENYERARSVYEMILSKEPGFTYVKNDLYPKLIDKMK
jgi:tetratricopeptide (TPR) repeat protein